MKKILMNKNTEVLLADYDSATGVLYQLMKYITLIMLLIS